MEEKLFARSENEVSATIDTLENLILELHLRVSPLLLLTPENQAGRQDFTTTFPGERPTTGSAQHEVWLRALLLYDSADLDNSYEFEYVNLYLAFAFELGRVSQYE